MYIIRSYHPPSSILEAPFVSNARWLQTNGVRNNYNEHHGHIHIDRLKRHRFYWTPFKSMGMIKALELIIYDWRLPWKSGVECKENRLTDWLGRKQGPSIKCQEKNRPKSKYSIEFITRNRITHIKDMLLTRKEIDFLFLFIYQMKRHFLTRNRFENFKEDWSWNRERSDYRSIGKDVLFANYKLNKHFSDKCTLSIYIFWRRQIVRCIYFNQNTRSIELDVGRKWTSSSKKTVCLWTLTAACHFPGRFQTEKLIIRFFLIRNEFEN